MRENLRQKSHFAAKIQFEIAQGEGKHGDQALSWASAHRSVCSLAISLEKSLIRFRYTIFIFSDHSFFSSKEQGTSLNTNLAAVRAKSDEFLTHGKQEGEACELSVKTPGACDTPTCPVCFDHFPLLSVHPS